MLIGSGKFVSLRIPPCWFYIVEWNVSLVSFLNNSVFHKLISVLFLSCVFPLVSHDYFSKKYKLHPSFPGNSYTKSKTSPKLSHICQNNSSYWSVLTDNAFYFINALCYIQC